MALRPKLTLQDTKIQLSSQEYGGQRITLTALLGRARIPTQVDVGFGDAVIPTPVEIAYPTLLDFPAPHIRVYPMEVVIAEKVHAMVTLDMTNSRMKDFFDLWTLARLFRFDGDTLVQAIRATFGRRQTPLPQSLPVAFTTRFFDNPDKITQWQAFLRRNRIVVNDGSLSQVVAELIGFLTLPLQAAAHETSISVTWGPGGPWTPS